MQVRRDRPAAGATAQESAPAERQTIRIGPGALVAALLGLVLLVGVGVFALTRDDGEPTSPTTPTTQAQTGAGPIVDIPTPPTLSAAPGKGAVELTWTSADLERSDRFTVRVAQGEDASIDEGRVISVKSARRHVVEAKKGTKVCAQVRLDLSLIHISEPTRRS